MFCAKLKELQLSGDCPFSSTELRDPEERAADLLPISTDVHGQTGEDARRYRAGRGKVSLHTLGDSIRKLACPEVSSHTHVVRSLWLWRISGPKRTESTCVYGAIIP